MGVDILFWSFASLLLISALGVIALSHPVKSVLCLVLCFFAAAGLWLLLSAEFLALILMLVYVGAVMTLFLFIVMTLSASANSLSSPRLKFYLPIVIAIAALLAALLMYALPTNLAVITQSSTTLSNVHALGNILYTDYVLPFEVAAIILFAAMIAAISLTLYDPIQRKQQSIAAQVQIKSSERIKLIK